MDIKLIAVSALVLALAAAGVHAHGEKHSDTEKVDYANAEQMPFGMAADPRKAALTVRMEMADSMRFTPAELRLKRGQTVRFVIANKGIVMHEMVLGTMEDLKKHAELMKKFPGMEHDEPHMAHVAPGKSGEIGWRFTKPGTYFYACLIPGHFEAGMIGKLIVD